MDRQPGWRLAIIVWGLLCPAAIDAGAGLWGLFVPGSRVPWFTLPETAAYSMIAAMPIAALTAFPHIHRVVGAVTVLLVLSGLACWAVGGKFGSRHSAPDQAAGTELLVPAPAEPSVHNV
jgi:hypothetical protein